MSKQKRQFQCNNCGTVTHKWTGQCSDCNSWNTIIEIDSSNSGDIAVANGNAHNLHYLDDDVEQNVRVATSINELNRVLGGGIVAGSAILIGGDPGIGKSTLLLQLSAGLVQEKIGCLYITGEESITQIKLRAQRLELSEKKTAVVSITNVEDIIATIKKNINHIKIVIIDSIQTIATSSIESAPGTVSQIRASAHLLVSYAKKHNIALFIACHVNKDGQLAGPKILEHMVDVVLYFEGDHINHYRMIRTVKNRFGAVNELGVFEMSNTGLLEVSNPSEFFLMDDFANTSGSGVFATIEGSRPFLVEIQALITPSNMVAPRRSVVGWDTNRLSMIIAVLNLRLSLNLTNYEIYLNVAGGLKIDDSAADLVVAATLISVAKNIVLPKDSVFFGELSLSGQVKKVSYSDQRINEAKKLGFQNIYCNIGSNKKKNNNGQSFKDVNIHQINHIIDLYSIITSFHEG